MIEPAPELIAHIDETASLLRDSRLMYGIAAEEALLVTELGKLLLSHRPLLRYHDETLDRRMMIARTVAGLPMAGGIVVTRVTVGERQERARLVCWRRYCPTSSAPSG